MMTCGGDQRFMSKIGTGTATWKVLEGKWENNGLDG